MANNQKVEVQHLPQLRTNTHLFQLANPNYFGNIADQKIAKKYKPVIILGEYNSYYEQLECIGYSPETQTLGAVVNIKQPSGYNGSPCFGGSREYVRFYLDYDHTGAWVDSGITNFGIYDRNFTDTLSYYAELTLDPEQLACCRNTAILPRVRAILSWNTPPPPATPTFLPVWGNVLEADVQLAPNNHILCYLIAGLQDQQLKINPELLQPDFAKKYLPALNDINLNVQQPSPTPAELKKSYAGAVPDHRIALSTVSTLLNAPYAPGPDFLAAMLSGFDFANLIPIYTNPGFDTQWEALGCVGLDRDLSQLNATVIISQSLGYNGGLCTTGSKEYVAFYMDFGTGWVYMGTSSVAVHDIPRNNQDPLTYDVSLTVNLDPYRQAWCDVGKAKVLAILSWNQAPTPNDPNFQSIFGNNAQATVEVQPLPAGVLPGDIVPVIEMVGGMVVTDIDQSAGPNAGLATTSAGSASIIIGANQSPFYGRILVTGHIFNAPPGAQYRLLIQTPATSQLNPLLDKQSIQTDTSGVISLPITLTPTSPSGTDTGGWMPYLAVGPSVSIVDNLFGAYYTPSGLDGLYTVAIEMKDGSGIITPGVMAVTFRVNSEFPVPAIDITTGAGNCASFTIGNPISGTFSVTNTEYAGGLSLAVTPNNGAIVFIPPSTSNAPVASLSFALGTLSTNGVPAGGFTGNYTIDTSQMTVCGYNIRIDATDRTIINSVQLGVTEEAVQGFCIING